MLTAIVVFLLLVFICYFFSKLEPSRIFFVLILSWWLFFSSSKIFTIHWNLNTPLFLTIISWFVDKGSPYRWVFWQLLCDRPALYRILAPLLNNLMTFTSIFALAPIFLLNATLFCPEVQTLSFSTLPSASLSAPTLV